jgi:hypothetical protein
VYLKAYNPYISSYTNAMDTIDRYHGSSAFIAFQNVSPLPLRLLLFYRYHYVPCGRR